MATNEDTKTIVGQEAVQRAPKPIDSFMATLIPVPVYNGRCDPCLGPPLADLGKEEEIYQD
eukprot:scaffold660_cov365-Pavlova_lutheri.AAC.18